MGMPLHFLHTQKSFGHSWMLVLKSAPVTPSLRAAGLSKDGLVCRMRLSEREVGWNFHSQEFGLFPPLPRGPSRAWHGHTHLPCQLLEHVLEAVLYVILSYFLLE